MAVIVSCALVFLLLVLFARRCARRKDERARRDGLVIDGRPATRAEPEPDEAGFHDVTHGGRRFVTVDELIERERHATQRIPVMTRTRPTPYPRRGHL